MRTPLEVLSLYPSHDGSLASLLDSRCARDPERPFLWFQGREMSWDDFRSGVGDAARMLHQRGIGPGDRVAVMARNSDVYVVLFFALARLGAILVPVNPDLGVEEAGYVLGHAEVSAIFASAEALPIARAAADHVELAAWFASLDAGAPGAPTFPALLQAASAEGRVPDPTPGGADSACLILYTSGTTGFPKGVMHTQRNFVTAGEGFVERMHLQAEERLLCILPLFHINALFYSLGGAAAAGATLALAPRFSASGFWPLAVQSGATEVNIIAAVGHILARRPRTEYRGDHKLAKVYGAPISAEIYATFRDEFRIPTLIEGYGMTEVPGACNLPFAGPHVVGSMGQPARHPDPSLRFAELRVVDDAGRDLPSGEIGELWVKTPITMQGYYRDPEQTAAAFRDGWFMTGDLVRRDEDDFYYFVARRKDIIRKRGENIAGAELDRVIGSHPQVARAAAVAVPAELGEDDILVVVVREPGATLDAVEIAAWCAAHLAPIKRPRYVVFADALPETPTHRVAKFKLKNDPELVKRAVDLGA